MRMAIRKFVVLVSLYVLFVIGLLIQNLFPPRANGRSQRREKGCNGALSGKLLVCRQLHLRKRQS